MLTDAEIAALTPAQRRDLIYRLGRPIADSGVDVADLRRARRLRALLVVASVVVLVPWIAYLAFSLPHSYRAENWSATWTGFDVGLLIAMVAIAYLGWRRRLAVIAVAFVVGTLLICDAWFDVMTARPGDRDESILSAVVVELPLALVFISGGLRAIRLFAERLWLSEPGSSVWRIALPLPATRLNSPRPPRG